MSVGNLVKLTANLWDTRSLGVLIQAWKNLAWLLEGDYHAIGEDIHASAILHADETG